MEQDRELEDCQKKILEILDAADKQAENAGEIAAGSETARELAELYNRMGKIYLARAELDKALSCCEAAGEMNPASAETRALLADIQARLPRPPFGPETFGKNIIMCVTTGRSGTNLLEKLFALADDTCALHEPEPGFQNVLRAVRQDPNAAVAFMRQSKLPFIAAQPQKNYAETSHVFSKGFFEAFIKIGIPFRTVILDRAPRAVAKSYWRLKTIPHRTELGLNWLLDPAQGGVVAPQGWEKMSDYQLCFWYCLEIERRKTLYMEECRKRGLPVAEISLHGLKDWGKFKDLCAACGLTVSDDARGKHAAITAHKVNTKASPLSEEELKDWKKFQAWFADNGLELPPDAEKNHAALVARGIPPEAIFTEKEPDIPFAEQEEAVWQALGPVGTALRDVVRARYAGDPEFK